MTRIGWQANFRQIERDGFQSESPGKVALMKSNKNLTVIFSTKGMSNCLSKRLYLADFMNLRSSGC